MQDRMLDIAGKLLAVEDINEMLTLAIDHAIESSGAEHGMVLFRDRETGLFVEIARKQGGGESVKPWSHISRAIVEEAMQQDRTSCLHDAMRSARVRTNGSAIIKKIRSVCCVPLSQNGRNYGVLYLESRSKVGLFDKLLCESMEQYARFISQAAFRVYSQKELEERLHAATHSLSQKAGVQGIVGHDPSFLKVLKTVLQVAPTDSTTLIMGESGTGKELVAKALHAHSPRKDAPFVTVNCGALSDELIISELFGHKRGAFTGAVSDKEGWFAKADQGTIFLDEIAELPLALQTKLLRVLQSGEYSVLGSSEVRVSDARVIAATNRDLQQQLQQNRFREDLFYRLSVVDIRIPPLRERKGDIPYLIQHFLKKCGRATGKQVRLEPDVERALLEYDYPGNVRELENLIERLVVLSRHATAKPSLLPVHVLHTRNGNGPSAGHSLREVKSDAAKDAELAFIISALRATQGNISQAAKIAGVDASNFHKLVKNHDLNVQQFRQ